MDPTYGRRNAAVHAHMDLRDILPSIRVPTLVLHRREDSAIDPGHSAYLAEHIPGARMVWLEGRDSLPFLGDSEQVAGDLGFLVVRHFHAGRFAERVEVCGDD